MHNVVGRVMFLVAMISAAGCGGGNGGGGAKNGNGAACTTTSDCGADEVCLAVAGVGSCSVDCSVSVDACGASSECAAVGALSVDVCQDPAQVRDDEAPAEDQDDRVALACTTDADCDIIQPGAVCATWRGYKECTILCNNDNVCNPPAVAGFETSFMTCGPDESADRRVCVPDEDCFMSPQSCVSFGF